MDSVLRPRDIQARIRSGESPETVAAAAQTTVEAIMVYASPVLAERAYIAQQAQRASVRRRVADGPARHLGDAVAQRLSTLELEPEDVSWDAWQRGDGRWALTASYRSSAEPREAHFVFDSAGRYVMAEDEESRWLVGEQAPASPASVDVRPVEDPVAPQAPAAAEDPVPAASPATSPATNPAHDAASDAATSPAVTAPSAVPPAAADRLALVAEDNEGLFAPSEITSPGAEADNATESPSAPAAPEDDSATTAEGRPAERTRGRSRRRASVPSWDEIMFGSS